jgi:long-chain acyl-CoA synthetase
VNLADLVREAARRTPDKPALLYRDAVMTWGELERHVAATAGGLAALGLAPGDRVGIAVGNTPGFVVSYFGALRGGFVAVPVNTGYTPAELAHVLGDSGAVAVVGSRSAAPDLLRLRDELPALRHVVVSDTASAPEGTTSLDAVIASGGSGVAEGVGGGEDLAVLIYTSGTSGRPKGAMLPHRALLANLDQCCAITPPVVQADDVVLLVLPLFHIYGLNPGLGMVARTGATGVLVERFDPVDTLAEIERRHVTNVVGAPPMYVAWSMIPDLSGSFATVRLLVSGAAPLPAAVLGSILDRTGQHVFEGYGLTETSPVLTTTLMSEVAKPASIGKPVPGVELKIVDDAGDEVDEEDPGEIVVRGANVFAGYWPDGAEGPGKDGWFATGDVAYADADGDLFLVDRRKELILVSGFNVYPREVEDVLLRHPDVEEAAVIGIPHPYTGEAVKALVVVRAGAQLSVDDVVAHCVASLARFKCPSTVEFVEELPHSATGKVSKGRLRESAGLLAR